MHNPDFSSTASSTSTTTTKDYEQPPVVHGLSYPNDFLPNLPVLLPRPAPHQAVRAVDAKQFADIHLAHLTSDVTDSVLFPFLHGLEGENLAQNSFFANACGLKHEKDPLPGAPSVSIPRYRGLIWVACDEDENVSASSGSQDCRQTDDEDFDFDDDEEEEEEEEVDMVVDDDDHTHDNGREESSLDITSHMHPEIFRTTETDIKTKPTAPIPIAMSTSLQNTYDRRLSVSSTATSSSDSHYGFEPISESSSMSSSLPSPTSTCLSPDIDADMPVSTSTVAAVNASDCIPSAPISPPTPPLSPPTPPEIPYLTSTVRASDILTTNLSGLPAFVPPRIPDGISLRNFGIQLPIYATLSDIVVYSRNGSTRAAFALAERFKHAIELQAAERAQRATERGYKVKFIGGGCKSWDTEQHDWNPERGHTQLIDKNGCMDVDQGSASNDDTSNEKGDEKEHAEESKAEAEQPVVELVLYNVFVLTDSLSSVAEKTPWLLNGTTTSSKGSSSSAAMNGPVAPTNSDGSENIQATASAESQNFSKGSLKRPPVIDFAHREREEMRELTRATPIIGENVFLGNSGDVPISKSRLKRVNEGEEEDPFDNSDNPLGFDICIECHDYSTMPTSIQLRQVEMQLAALDALWAAKSIKNLPAASAAGIPMPQQSSRPAPSAAQIIHISVAALPQSFSCTIQAYISLLNFLQGLIGGCSSSDDSADNIALKARSRKARILIYSSDGYTESSILALSLLMKERALDLPSAYLELQVEKGRSFFVYQNDLGILKRIEAQLRTERERESRVLPQRVNSFSGTNNLNGRPRGWSNTWSSSYQSQSFPYSYSGSHPWMATGVRNAPHVRSASNSVSYTSSPLANYVVPSQGPSTSPNHRRPRASTSPPTPMHIDHQTWFNDHRFDGSFPSRVLPFLYLGNLNHATNAYMLHALGITHVVSVGECALVPPENIATDGSPSGYQFVPGKGPKGEGSLWIEEREGRIKVLDIKGVCDDGIDSLQPQLAPICDWIDRARLDGGKVLVHCRVGVSRSATVTIAYVMKYLNIPLVDAYLIVRSRRLSVLIQPNMRLLYNLCSWELKLAQERSAGDNDKLRLELSRSLNWPYLAREVHRLNEKYLT